MQEDKTQNKFKAVRKHREQEQSSDGGRMDLRSVCVHLIQAVPRSCIGGIRVCKYPLYKDLRDACPLDLLSTTFAGSHIKHLLEPGPPVLPGLAALQLKAYLGT